MNAPHYLVDLIYEAAFVPDHWETVLNDMAAQAGGAGTVLFNSNAVSTKWRASSGIMDMIERILREDWGSRNDRAKRLLGKPYSGFFNEAEEFTDEEYNTFPIYTDLMQPLGYGFGAGTAISVPSGDHIVFSVERKRANGPMTGADISFLDGLRPHLARAAMMAGRLEFERINAAVRALELTGLPSAVLTERGTILAHNALLATLGKQISFQAFNKFSFASPAANTQLTEALQQFRLGKTQTLRACQSFPLPQIDDTPAAVAHLLPICGNARDIFASAAFFLLVTPVDKQKVPTATVIQGLFDLSVAEARVAQFMSTGNDIPSVAQQLGVSTETIRTHVKSIFRKTGTARQSELAALLSSISSF
jgi:DNA-binding CsgD family transcriptional regulator